MAPNLALLAITPALTGFTAEASWLHRLYEFVVETQSHRAEQEVAAFLRSSGRELPRD